MQSLHRYSPAKSSCHKYLCIHLGVMSGHTWEVSYDVFTNVCCQSWDKHIFKGPMCRCVGIYVCVWERTCVCRLHVVKFRNVEALVLSAASIVSIFCVFNDNHGSQIPIVLCMYMWAIECRESGLEREREINFALELAACYVHRWQHEVFHFNLSARSNSFTTLGLYRLCDFHSVLDGTGDLVS